LYFQAFFHCVPNPIQDFKWIEFGIGNDPGRVPVLAPHKSTCSSSNWQINQILIATSVKSENSRRTKSGNRNLSGCEMQIACVTAEMHPSIQATRLECRTGHSGHRSSLPIDCLPRPQIYKICDQPALSAPW